MMNWKRVESDWQQLKWPIQQWGTLTDDDLEHIEGKRERLLGRLKDTTGKEMDEIEVALSVVCGF